MKIGVYLDDVTPTLGGANSLVKTILSELDEKKNGKFEFEFFTWSQKGPKQFVIDGYNFINLRKKLPYTFFFKKFLNFKYNFNFSNNALNRYLRTKNIDLFWMVTPAYMDLEVPYIFTVWDLGHRTVSYFPEVSKNKEISFRERMYQKMIPSASYILTGNDIGKNEIIENYPCVKEKINIAPFPISFFCFGEEIKPKFVDDNKMFFFYPAQFWAHKNHIRIIKAASILKEKYPNILIYFTGSDHGNKDYILEMIRKYGLQENVVITGFLSYPEMKYMYTHAQAMVFASLMGPNNLPPIEATYLGCPVIITDIEGHKEQLGNSAIYFNGLDEQDLANKMELVILGNGFTKEMKDESMKLAKEFGQIKYCDPIIKIINEYEKVRDCWR